MKDINNFKGKNNILLISIICLVVILNKIGTSIEVITLYIKAMTSLTNDIASFIGAISILRLAILKLNQIDLK